MLRLVLALWCDYRGYIIVVWSQYWSFLEWSLISVVSENWRVSHCLFGQPFLRWYSQICTRMLQTYVKNSRGLEVFLKSWVPAERRPKGLIFICHGYGDTVTFFFEGQQLKLALFRFFSRQTLYLYLWYLNEMNEHTARVRGDATTVRRVLEMCHSLLNVQFSGSYSVLDYFRIGASSGSRWLRRVWHGLSRLWSLRRVAWIYSQFRHSCRWRDRAVSYNKRWGTFALLYTDHLIIASDVKCWNYSQQTMAKGLNNF